MTATPPTRVDVGAERRLVGIVAARLTACTCTLSYWADGDVHTNACAKTAAYRAAAGRHARRRFGFLETDDAFR